MKGEVAPPAFALPSAARVIGWLRSLPLVPLLMVAPMIVFGLFGGWITGGGGESPDLSASLQPPAWLEGGSWQHLLGTDQFGRDLVLRLIEGARVSLIVCCAGVLLAALIGVTVGVASGYAGGALDAGLMRLVDVQMSIPAVLLTILIGAAIGGGLWTVVISIVLVFWADYARVIRGETLSLKLRPFVDLAIVANASALRVVLRHILPNLVPTILVLMTLQFGRGLIIEAAITFIGLGIQPPDTAWGTLIAEGRTQLETAWWIPTFAGVLITITVLGANLLGDRIRDRLDPKLRRRTA